MASATVYPDKPTQLRLAESSRLLLIGGHLAIIHVTVLDRLQPEFVFGVSHVYFGDSGTRFAQQRHWILSTLMHPIDIKAKRNVLWICIMQRMPPFPGVVHHFGSVVMHLSAERASPTAPSIRFSDCA